MSWTRVGTVLLLAVTIPVAQHIPALAALTVLTAITVGMVATEVVVLDEGRRALRGLVFEERTSHEAHEAAYRARWHEPHERDEGE